MLSKRQILAAVAAACLAAPIAVLADGLGTGIATPGSPHNFADDLFGSDGTPATFNELGSSGGWNGRNEICRVCHVPHDHGKATQRYTNGLLWNHGISSATYTMYDSTWSDTLDNAQSAQPDGTAKLCLGCHDGTVALDTFDKYAGTAGNEIQSIDSGISAGFQVSSFMDGTNIDLRGTHPLSITYDETVDTGLNPKTTAMGTSGTIDDVLDNGKVQCSSCHDVHDSAGEAVAGTHLLRVSTKTPASGLCLTCHKK